MPKTNSECCRKYRLKKKELQNKTKKIAQSSSERVRQYRARRKETSVPDIAAESTLHTLMEANSPKSSIMFYETCRLCLDQDGNSDIFEKTGLSMDIYRCTGVKVSPSDNLPQTICKNCLDIVNKATDLRKLAKQNDCHLKRLFGDENSKESEHRTESVIGNNFGKHNNTPESISAIEKFLKVRLDLFESSEAEDSIIKREISQPDSSQQTDSQNSKQLEDDTEYEICDTYYVIEDTVVASELAQTDKTEKPVSEKKVDEENKYECLICSKTFKTNKKLYLHNRLHNKNFACPLDMCGKKFSTRGDMQKHIRTHTGEKPYACDKCDKRFTQSGTLKTHKYVHIFG